MADDIKSLAKRVEQLEKDLKTAQLALGKKVNMDEVKGELKGLQIVDLQKDAVELTKRVAALEAKQK
jgi:hypothetical protein